MIRIFQHTGTMIGVILMIISIIWYLKCFYRKSSSIELIAITSIMFLSSFFDLIMFSTNFFFSSGSESMEMIYIYHLVFPLFPITIILFKRKSVHILFTTIITLLIVSFYVPDDKSIDFLQGSTGHLGRQTIAFCDLGTNICTVDLGKAVSTRY